MYIKYMYIYIILSIIFYNMYIYIIIHHYIILYIYTLNTIIYNIYIYILYTQNNISCIRGVPTSFGNLNMVFSKNRGNYPGDYTSLHQIKRASQCNIYTCAINVYHVQYISTTLNVLLLIVCWPRDKFLTCMPPARNSAQQHAEKVKPTISQMELWFVDKWLKQHILQN